jgi:hypothetical protein
MLNARQAGQEARMHSNRESIEEFRRLLKKGSIQTAYRAVLSYMMALRTHFKKRLGDSAVSGLYQGYMDVTFFALFPPSLRHRHLKIAVVFNYDAFRFEAWLAGRNRGVQRHYWKLLKDAPWPEYRVVAPAAGVDSILECDLASNFDLDDPDVLTALIEANTLSFIDQIDEFLSAHPPSKERVRPSVAGGSGGDR